MSYIETARQRSSQQGTTVQYLHTYKASMGWLSRSRPASSGPQALRRTVTAVSLARDRVDVLEGIDKELRKEHSVFRQDARGLVVRGGPVFVGEECTKIGDAAVERANACHKKWPSASTLYD